MEGYETILITDPNLTNEESTKVISKFKDLITKQGGSTEFESFWGRRRLAYEVKKKDFGNYHLLYFAGNRAVIEELKTQFKYDDNILKYMLVKVDNLEESYTKFEAIKANPLMNVTAIMDEEE